MFSHNKSLKSISILFAVGFVLYGCSSAPTSLPNPINTASIQITDTPDDLSNITDAMMETDRANALKAATTLVSSLPNATQEEITKAVFTKWLDYYKTDQMNAYLRLKDYKIEQVTAKGGCDSATKSKYLSSVQYSVQTVTPHPGDWVASAGNLTLTPDNWIYQITASVGITVDKDVYTMNLEGVPPCSN